jgi:predicted aspartyl protease
MTSLIAFLEASSYRQVPLRRNGAGHFEAAGILTHRPVRVLIDTGAASPVVSRALAQELGLEVQPLGRRGGGANGANFEIFEVRGADLRLGSVLPRTRGLFAVNLTHVNASLTQKGQRLSTSSKGADDAL